MKYLDKLHPRKAGMVSNVVETVEYGAFSYGYGFLQNKYRGKASVKGVPADVLAGVGFKAAALLMDAFGGSAVAKVSPHINVLGNAGIGAFFHTLGAGHGAKSAGVTRLLLAPGTDVKKAKAMLPGSEVLGGIPPAPKGDFLSSSELAAMAR